MKKSVLLFIIIGVFTLSGFAQETVISTADTLATHVSDSSKALKLKN